jgi:hypothetical protein
MTVQNAPRSQRNPSNYINADHTNETPKTPTEIEKHKTLIKLKRNATHTAINRKFSVLI